MFFLITGEMHIGNAEKPLLTYEIGKNPEVC
jgi:hypothetical protein